MFLDIVERVHNGNTRFYFVKVKAHTEYGEGAAAVNAGNVQADTVARRAAREGVHTGEATMKLVNFRPSLAIRSMLGVLIVVEPKQLRSP